jgi:hypothetical protein
MTTTARNIDLVQEIRSERDKETRKDLINKLIELNIPFVYSQAESYLNERPQFKFMYDDLVSAGLLALTKAAHDIIKRGEPSQQNSPSAFFKIRISWAFSNVSRYEARQQIPENYTLPNRDDCNPERLLEIRDILQIICETEEDQIIIEMRGNGSNDQMIAGRLCVSRSTVAERRKELFNKFKYWMYNRD